MKTRQVVLDLHPVQKHFDFTYFEANPDPTVPEGERADGYYFPKRDWVEMDCPESINITVGTATPVVIEELCEVMHDAYEKAAVGAGWETQEASRKPWADVPDANKETMRSAVRALIDYLAI